MSDKSTLPAEETPDEAESSVPWPLPYRLQTSAQTGWWSYRLYRGPEDKKVQILYSKDKVRSEELAQKFLDEPVVGFDMEWPCFPNSDRLQEKIGLIQVASEDTIALFHIGLHPGKSTDEIIAPSLRKLIESPTIAKTGVGILSADFARLRRFFGLKPRGAFELSHMDCLVKFSNQPDLLTTRMVALADLVEKHLKLPLAKGLVRTSNWSRPLSQKQIDYAASDAYVGFMLFHCMNAKRVALKPVPPLPIFAEQYSLKPAAVTMLMLHPVEDGGSMVLAKDFFSPPKKESDADEGVDGETDTIATTNAMKRQKMATKTKAKAAEEPLSHIAQALYDQLSDRRKAFAEEQEVPAYLIATNAVLRGLAERSPQNEEELLEVKGIGKVTCAKYGAGWLEVIAQHAAVHGVQKTISETSIAPDDSQRTQPSTPTRNAMRRTTDTDASPESSPAFGSPTQRTPTLHTGLSFTLAETNLAADDTAAIGPPSPSLRRQTGQPHYEDSAVLDLTDVATQGASVTIPANGGSRQSLKSGNTSEDSLVFMTPPSRSPSALKRKREARPNTVTSTPAGTQPAPLSPQSKIFRSKLVAFSKFVTSNLASRPPDAAPIVSASTLDQIVAVSPRTIEELHRIAGVEEFARACKDTQMDLLKNIIKFAPARR